MNKAAAVIPTDCMAKLKFRATEGFISKINVITGKAIAPPPSELAPAMNDPKTMVSDMNQFF